MPVFVKRWPDCTSKYGLAYELSDGRRGCYFNDYSLIFKKADDTLLIRDPSKALRLIEPQACADGSLDQIKCTLFAQFNKYLSRGQRKVQESKMPLSSTPLEVGATHMHKVVKAEAALIFKLSNKLIQLSFKDKSELFIDSVQKTVTFVKPDGSQTCSKIRDVIGPNCSNHDI